MSNPNPREDGYDNVHPAFKDALAMVSPDPIRDIAPLSISLGRQQMALAVLECWNGCANASDALDAIIALCREEATT